MGGLHQNFCVAAKQVLNVAVAFQTLLGHSVKFTEALSQAIIEKSSCDGIKAQEKALAVNLCTKKIVRDKLEKYRCGMK